MIVRTSGGCAEAEIYRRLTDQGLQVMVIGMSMGGTVATRLSARLPMVGTVLINLGDAQKRRETR